MYMETEGRWIGGRKEEVKLSLVCVLPLTLSLSLSLSAVCASFMQNLSHFIAACSLPALLGCSPEMKSVSFSEAAAAQQAEAEEGENEAAEEEPPKVATPATPPQGEGGAAAARTAIAAQSPNRSERPMKERISVSQSVSQSAGDSLRVKILRSKSVLP